MASLIREKDGRYRIQFTLSRKRKSIGLGSLTERQATRWLDKVEELVQSVRDGQPLDGAVSKWLSKLDDRMHDKLSRTGLVDARATDGSKRESVTLLSFFDAYLTERADLKNSSLTVYRNVRRNIEEFFGPGKRLKDITEFEAQNFRRFLTAQKGYAEPTASRRCGVVKTVVGAAIDHRLIERDPFRKLKTTVRGNQKKRRMVTIEETELILEACPSAEWRLLVALARFAGMRIPSEAFHLRWADIDWKRDRIRFHVPKTEHHEGHGERCVPLFPELIDPLRDAFEQSDPGSEFVINRLRPASLRDRAGNFKNASLSTRFKKIIRKAGLEPWPKPFTNLRASRDTELREQFPDHVVEAWIGHSGRVAKEHYLMVTDDHYAMATALKQQTVQKPVQYGPEPCSTNSHAANKLNKNTTICKEKRPHARTRDRSNWTILDLNQ